MNTDERFTQTLSEWLGEEAAHRVPDHLAEVLVQTAATRQRPWWSSLERLLPMTTTLRLSPVPRLGLLLLLAMAVLAALGIALLAAGSRSAPLAPVAGLARNGAMAYDRDGDIYRYDPVSGAETLLVGGADTDSRPMFSRDGSRFLFTRRQGAGKSAVMIANADGNGIRKVIDEPTDWTWTDWSPDGTKIAFGVSTAGTPSIVVVNADGSGMTSLEVGMAATSPSWVGPDGTEILFRGEGPRGVGLFLMKADGTGTPHPVPGAPVSASSPMYHDPVVSLDGTRVAFSSFERSSWQPVTGERSAGWDGMIEEVHVLDLINGTDMLIPPGTDPLIASQPVDEFLPKLSPDGRVVVFNRDRSDGAGWLGAAPSDGSEPGHAVGSEFAVGDEGLSYQVSPDGTILIATYPGEAAARLLPIAGGAGSSVPTSRSAIPSMQRLAP